MAKNDIEIYQHQLSNGIRIAHMPMDRGVSRLHAQLELKDNKLYITDLNSTNGTYVNAVRIEPHQASVLHKGDDVILGRLAVQVLFR